MAPFVILTALATLSLVVAEVQGSRPWQRISKPVASLGFLLAAHAAGALSSHYGRVAFAALVCCLVGDLLLLSESKRVFAAGLGSFLLAHALFASAFWQRGVDRAWTLFAIGAVALPALAVIRWLSAHTRGPMRIAVGAYVMTIALMFSTAAGTTAAHLDWRIATGALLFLLSDIAVARNRFVERAAINRVVGLPLYYAAQLLLAASLAPGA